MLHGKSIDEVKRQIRREVRQLLAELSDEQKGGYSESVVDHICRDDQYRRSSQIGLYFPVEWEINLMGLFDKGGIEMGKQFAFPRWNRNTRHYEFARVLGRNQLMRGRFGVEEPSEECEFVPGRLLDITFVPGVAFSRSGVRLGRGKGFYDRLLKGIEGQIVGICCDLQVLDEIPAEEWDMPMDRIITETGQRVFA